MGRGRRHDTYRADIQHALVVPRKITLLRRSGRLDNRR
jgi:hypothetical protein